MVQGLKKRNTRKYDILCKETLRMVKRKNKGSEHKYYLGEGRKGSHKWVLHMLDNFQRYTPNSVRVKQKGHGIVQKSKIIEMRWDYFHQLSNGDTNQLARQKELFNRN